jgi:light-regulated signal transduction histidine kinase (bacteriophytochrome)
MQFVKSGAQQMNTLVQDILEISTLNNPDEKKKTKVDLNEVLTKVQANLTEEINSKNAVVNADVLPYYYCDEAEFLLLFQNMIQNGIKYNESKIPTIDISSQRTKKQLLISFKDNGIGIDNEYHSQIFQFFKRLHTSEKYQGTGLGLGLCKKIVNSYGGDIEVDSVSGKGSTFRIKLELGSL